MSFYQLYLLCTVTTSAAFARTPALYCLVRICVAVSRCKKGIQYLYQVACSLWSETDDLKILALHIGENYPRWIVTCGYHSFPCLQLTLEKHPVFTSGNWTFSWLNAFDIMCLFCWEKNLKWDYLNRFGITTFWLCCRFNIFRALKSREHVRLCKLANLISDLWTVAGDTLV